MAHNGTSHEEYELESSSVLKKTCDIEYGIVNPQTPHDLHPMVISGQDPTPILGKVIQEQSLVKERTDNRWGAICMRVDYNFGGQVEVKARIPEKDGQICDPPEYVPADVDSNSHYFTNKHRTYKWEGKCPTINQKIFVSIPPDGSYKTPGKILDLTDEYYGVHIKSAAMADQSEIPPPQDEEMCHAEGAGIGSGESDMSLEVPPVC